MGRWRQSGSGGAWGSGSPQPAAGFGGSGFGAPAPAAAAPAPLSLEALTAFLTNFYTQHNPENLGKVGKSAAKYLNNQTKLCR